MLNLVLALLAGVVTVAAPCTLPMPPILLGASVGQTGKVRPAMIALGLVMSFAMVALLLGAITRVLDFDPDVTASAAIAAQGALKRHGITYPVAQDNDSRTWNAYRNRYWPSQYIVDQSGKIVLQHDGEGQYEQIERTVARLLNANS